jgi:molybdate-binding protein
VHSETWSKVSVVLFDRQIVHLDRLATDIRGRSGKVLNRAEIIRALIDGLIDSGMDISATASEADLRARVARRLGSPYR